MSRRHAVVMVLDDNGRERGYLTQPDGTWYDVYTIDGQYRGAGKTLEAAIEMVREKTGLAFEELPTVDRSDVTIIKGHVFKINNFQGGGWYRYDVVVLKDQTIGTLFSKQQPARRRYVYMTNMEGGGSITGHDLGWLVRQAGYRLVDSGQARRA